MHSYMNSSKGVFIKADGELAELVKKTLIANGVKEKDIEKYDEAKLQKGSLIAFLQEKTASTIKLRIARIEDMAEGDVDLVQEKEIESSV